MGTDGCGGQEGWYVDNVQAYYCSADLFPAISVPQTSVTSQQSQRAVVTKTLSINNVGSANLTWQIIEALASLTAKTNEFKSTGAPEVINTERKSPVQSQPFAKRAAAPEAPDATNVVQDGSFEDGSPNAYWDEFSAAFGTPLCDPTCGGAGARTGDWWIWFGGAGSNAAENGYVSQTITITTGLAKLNFWLTLGGSGTGNVTVTLDSTIVFTANQTMTPTYGLDYAKVSIDVTAFANGQPHVLKFSESDPATAGSFNAFVDDVSLDVTACTPTNLPWLNVSPTSGTTISYTTSSVNVTFNSNGLAAGNYSGKLCVTSNDPAADVIEIPVSMKVIPNIFLPIIRR